MIWVIAANQATGPYVALNNKNLKEISWNETALSAVVTKCLSKHLLIGLALAVILGYLFSSFSLFLLCTFITAIYFFVRRSIFVKDLRQQIQNHL